MWWVYIWSLLAGETKDMGGGPTVTAPSLATSSRSLADGEGDLMTSL